MIKKSKDCHNKETIISLQEAIKWSLEGTNNCEK